MEALIQKQATTSGLIIRIVSNLRKLGRTNITKGTVRARISQLDGYWSHFQSTHHTLLQYETTGRDESYFTDSMFDAVAEQYAVNKAELLDLLDEFEPPQQPTQQPVANSTIGGEAQQSSILATTIVRQPLPKIEVPTFSGEFTEWPNYSDLFRSLIHANTTLSDVQRLHYLKMSLQGEAQQILKNLTVTAANYGPAWDSLVARYEDKRRVIHALMQKLMKMAPMKSESPIELKRVYDGTREILRALQNMARPVDQWDDWLVYITVDRLDQSSRRDWEKLNNTKDTPATYKELETFLTGRIRELEILEPAGSSKQKTSVTTKAHAASARDRRCADCNGKHFILSCPAFRKKTPVQRKETVAQKQVCFNCLSSGHLIGDCSSAHRCNACGGHHHSMLHLGPKPPQQTQETPVVASSPVQPAALSNTSQAHHSVGNKPKTAVLLATARVDVRDSEGKMHMVRALLDQGSEASFVTESLVQRLKLTRQSANVSVSGLGGASTGKVRGLVALQLRSRVNNEAEYTFDAFILATLTSYLPSTRTTVKHWPHLVGLPLADPDFEIPAKIDMVIGAHLYSELLMVGLVTGPAHHPVAQQTTLGWVLSGPIPIERLALTHNNLSTCSLHCVSNEELSQGLVHFWETEETARKLTEWTEDEVACDNHFSNTHTRTPQGRYVIRLPFRSDELRAALGDSRKPAQRMLSHMESRFAKDKQLAQTYAEFMDEYQTLGHMEPAKEPLTNGESGYFMPHHAVIKSQSSTTKLRVVYNASQVTTTGFSLNDVLHVGPKLQQGISDITLRWRMHQHVFSADIEKMYRQIRVHLDDVDHQRILWRSKPENPVQEFRLLTVTYGTSSAPYLALKVLRQLADDEKDRFPLGSRIIKDDMYVDEALSGADTIAEAQVRQQECIGILEAGGFHPRKWAASDPKLLANFPEDQRETLIDLKDRTEAAVPILGLHWKPQSDTYGFRVQLPDSHNSTTKRKILSDISRLYDPLGWLGPVIITAKILLQTLWMEGVDWDTTLSQSTLQLWTDYREQLPLLGELPIPRWTGHRTSALGWEIHGFSDASERAYAAVVYLRIVYTETESRITLLTAKTKVAPVKRISVPRLELNGAVLLARLTRSVCETLAIPEITVHLWTDSTVVLAWIKTHSSRWKTYVANRVSEIQTTAPTASWHHVPSSDNPADCASRGLLPSELKAHTLWWSGPHWLQQNPREWPSATPLPTEETDVEAKMITAHAKNQAVLPIWDLVEKYSTLRKLLRVTAYCMRFVHNTKNPTAERLSGHLKTIELLKARNFWISTTQKAHFYADYAVLQLKQPVPRESSLLRLKPSIDESGLIRVGGRLRHAILQHDEKYPVILPKGSRLTVLIIDHAHLATLHGGAQLTLSYLRRTYWILGGRVQVQNFIRRCRVCLPYQWRPSVPRIGDLPKDRVTPARPFLHSGVDYAGPINVKTTKGRGYRSYKGYIALFVCMSTRAVHIEAVSDYTSASFISAYKRFTARRGICAILWSDQGTNFIGANKELRELFKEASALRLEVAEILANDGTEWKFISPASPHFGGLWEAGVRSVKHHLRRVIADQILTYEELTTLLAEIEACLNSRPIYALSDEPSDLEPLTPGHFLIGSAPRVIPEPSLLDTKPGRLSRWQLLRQTMEHFWTRWSKEYLKTLQQRYKWKVTKGRVQSGDLALLTDERLPPAKWALARVIDTHPGPDGEVRVVTLRTQGTTLTRPVVKLCILPRASDDDDERPPRTS